MKYLRNFEYFINPSSSFNPSYYDYLDFNCLEPCSYVDYIYFKTINGEIDSNPIPIDLDSIKNIIYDDVCIIAFNHCDKIAMFVDIFI